MFKWGKKLAHNRVVKRRRKARFECRAIEAEDGGIIVYAAGHEGQPYHAIAMALKGLGVKKLQWTDIYIAHEDKLRFDADRLKRVYEKYYRVKA